MVEMPDAAERESNLDFLDQRSPRSTHLWSSSPVTNIDFRSLVEESVNPRINMLRYRQILQVDSQGARDTFSQIPSGTNLFQIPPTIRCDRTFARRSQEAYYIDDMDQYLESEPGPLRVEDVPLFQRSLNETNMNSFNRRAEYYKEHLERSRMHHWIPHVEYERKHISDATACSTFPAVGQFSRDVLQPATMPLPCQTAVFYYHDELRAAQFRLRYGYELSMRAKRLLFCFEYEYYVLFIKFWWKKSVHGGRQRVLEISTITYLSDGCGHLPVVSGKPAQVILEHMKSAANRPPSCHNWMRFKDDCMEESAFIWAANGLYVPVPGEYDPHQASGKRPWCSTSNSRITSRRNAAATFRRDKSLLDKIVAVPDLERIPCLVPIIVKNQWHHRGNMKLSHLLDNLVNLHNCTNGILRAVTDVRPMPPVSTHERIAYPRETSVSPHTQRRLYITDRTRDRSASATGRDVVPYNHRDRDANYYEAAYHSQERRDRSTPHYAGYGSSNFDNANHRSPRRDRVSPGEQEQYRRVPGSRDNERNALHQGRHDSPLHNYGNGASSSALHHDGRVYHRTVDHMNNMEVDVYTEGARTPRCGIDATPGRNTGREMKQSGRAVSPGRDYETCGGQRTPRKRDSHEVRLELLSWNGSPLMYGENTAEANMKSARESSSGSRQPLRDAVPLSAVSTGNVPWYSGSGNGVQSGADSSRTPKGT